MIERGTRNPAARKRGRENALDGRNVKRQREDVIELSSDTEDPMVPQRASSGKELRIEVVSVSSGSDVDDLFDKDPETTLVDDEVQFTGESSRSNNNSPKSSLEASPSDKGKGKEVYREPALDLQEELECFICCLCFSRLSDNSDDCECSVHLFTMRPWCMWALQCFLLMISLI